MTNPELSFTDANAALMIMKDYGGIAALSGILKLEMALILPDGDTTLYTDFNGQTKTVTQCPGMRYLGVMRKEERFRRRQFDEIAPEAIMWSDKLVLADTDGARTVRPTIHGLQNRYSGYHGIFAS